MVIVLKSCSPQTLIVEGKKTSPVEKSKGLTQNFKNIPEDGCMGTNH